MGRVLLLILDGWGLAPSDAVSAIAQAHTPFIDGLYQRYPYARLRTDGDSVGLPKGQMGNSEVGHMHIGAGRVIPQAMLRLQDEIKHGRLQRHPNLLNCFAYLKQEKKALHIAGLLSDGGIHSHIHHLLALCESAHRAGLPAVYIHAFTDGRDCAPVSAIKYVEWLQSFIADKPSIRLAGIMGRYYAMDRDQRWQRTQLAYDALVHGKGKRFTNPKAGIEAAYSAGTTDEFIMPFHIIAKGTNTPPCVQAGDALMCFNFRGDRMRQLTQSLLLPQSTSPLPLRILTMTEYHARFEGVSVLYRHPHVSGTLGEVLAQHKKKQWRIAETEKYPHVTYFFSGGREAPFWGEKRTLCPSPTDVATYDLRPEMSAEDVCRESLRVIASSEADFICVNLANPDMVGHTGVFEAVVKACEVVDSCTARIATAATTKGYSVCIAADHGNAECMQQPDGSPHTAHTTYQVPFILMDKRVNTLKSTGQLSDIAPTLLHLMGIAPARQMNGQSLCKIP